MIELMDGARPLVERDNMTDLETVIQESCRTRSRSITKPAGWQNPSNAEYECRMQNEDGASFFVLHSAFILLHSE